LNIYPPSNAVTQIEFRYYIAPINIAALNDPIQIPDKYQDVLIAGVNEKCFIYLKRRDEATYWRGEYREGRQSIIRDFNAFPRGPEFCAPDAASQTLARYGDWFYDAMYNIGK